MNNSEFPQKYFGQVDKEVAKVQDIKNISHRKKFIELIKSLPQNCTVLDAGCGSGKYLKFILAYRPDIKVYAIDISNVSSYMPEQVKFTQCSVEDLDQHFPENTFDFIVSAHVIEHLLTPMKMMAACKKVLKPEGQLYIETPNWVRLFVPWLPQFFYSDYTHLRVFSKYTMFHLCKDFSFEIKFLKSYSSTPLWLRQVKTPQRSSVDQLTSKVKVKRLPGNLVNKIIIHLWSIVIKDIMILVAVNKK
jgi:ubiquinone/menaquinone biosynthesis C-methylase UbiE